MLCIKGQMPDDANGDCDTDANRIRIYKWLKKSKKQEILWHEIKHACSDIVGLLGKTGTDEDFISGLAPMEVQVLQDNPELVAYLSEKK